MDRGAKTGHVEPSRVGAYIISHKIGAGQFAKVYLGHHHKEGYAVAVKAIDRRRSPESNVHSEVRELVRLQGHPNIVRLYDTFENSTYMCAVLEFCAGGDLKQCVDTLVSERKLQSGEEKTGSSSNSAKVERRDVPTATATPPVIDEFTVRRLASQLISSMSYLSSMNVIHRDLKPENLLLTDKDVRKADLRIADLGFARAVHSQQMMTSYLGTAYYMAPERLRGDKYDFQAEVWATGLIMYEMVYGEHPFPANGVFDLSNKIRTKVLEFPRLDPEPSDALKDLLRRMIVEDPAKRITIDAAKEHEWFAITLPEPPVSTSHSTASTTPEEVRVETVAQTKTAAMIAESKNVGDVVRDAASTNPPHNDVAASEAINDDASPPITTRITAPNREVPESTSTPPVAPVLNGRAVVASSDNSAASKHHVDPSSFSVALMHDESNQKAAVRSNMPPKPHQSNQKKASPEASPQQTHSLHQEHTTNNVVGNTSFVEPFSLPPSSTSFATAPTGHSQHLVSNFSLTSNTVGSLSNRGGGGTSPIPPASHITSPPLAFSDPPAVGANIPSLIFQPVPIRRSMERAFVVKWAAENHPNRAHQVQLYQYAAQVAADFEPTSPSASSKATEVGAFRDVCLHRAKLLFQALNPVDRHAPPRGVCAFAAARLWMHTIHDARVASITPWVEMEAIYRAAALMCDIVSEDPTTEVSVRNQAGTMRELIQARWQRIADGVSPAVLYPY